MSKRWLSRLPALAACTTAALSVAVFATTGASAAATHYPLTISNCGTKVTFAAAPTRAVSNDINSTEDMLALGLQHAMVGDFGVDGDGPVGHPVPAQYLHAFHQVRDVSAHYFTLEQLIALRPDFLFAGWNYGLQAGTRLTPAGLAQFGIKTLALSESCAHVQSGRRPLLSLVDTYKDITNLGKIFNVQARATKLVDTMRAEVSYVQRHVSGRRLVRVFDYDSGTAAPFSGEGLATVNAIIHLAGGRNIFGRQLTSWEDVSWEQVVKAQPQCIIINNYGTPTATQKLHFLETNPATERLPAIRHRCVITLAYDEVTPGPRNAEAVLALAKTLHPTAFRR